LDKAPDAFRTISEVADDLDIPQHVLRFWETRFVQIKPMKRSGGRRYYRPDDVDLLRGIRRLLYGEGYTIRGVQRILKEHGIKSVQGLVDGSSAAPSFAAIDEAALREPADTGEDASGIDIDEDEEVTEAPAMARRAPEAATPLPRVEPLAPAVAAVKAENGGAVRRPDVPKPDIPRLDVPKLKTVLEELIACRQLLDQAMKEGQP
jgi:DNA-binding transcriptional MerR regulator